MESEEGRTIVELESLVRTRVHQAVNACLSEKRIGRFYLGRYAVYVSADREVAASQEARRLGRSPQLAEIVPRGQRDAFDIITHVGVEHFLHGRELKEISEEVRDPESRKEIPSTSLHEISRKFLYYLGELHRQSAPALRNFFQAQGGAVWLGDGTLEPGSSVFFGVKEARTGISLCCDKIPSENIGDISRCMREAAALFGTPKRIRHDLSPNISDACEETFPAVPHDVCHYHLLADIGEDLSLAPQNALAKRLRALKLQLRMKDQRSGQTQWLRQNITDPESLSLTEALAQAAKEAGPFNHWLRATRPKLIGRLPTRLIRQEGFINQLLTTYNQHTQARLEHLSPNG